MSNQLAVFPQQVLSTAATPVSTVTVGPEGNFTPRASVSIQADPSNVGVVFIGNSLMVATPTQYARALKPGDWFSISGSAINAGKIYARAATAGDIIHTSGS